MLQFPARGNAKKKKMAAMEVVVTSLIQVQAFPLITCVILGKTHYSFKCGV